MSQLLYFVHVAGTASFAAAARELDVEPNTIRLAMNELEAALGLQLFDRSPQRIALTPPGRLMLPLAQRILYLATVIGTAAGTS
jgi:LysR family transcriptional regulator, hydrogen peroxide-inducible genes activator